MDAILEIAFLGDPSGGESFLDDVESMIAGASARAGIELQPVKSTRTERGYRVVGCSVAPPALVPELGVHRAQIHCGPHGLIRTFKVVVAVEGRPETAIIRTYSYPLSRVSFHRSGTRAPLREVLDGRGADHEPEL